MKPFIHLHAHSQHSILDGAILIPQLIQQLKKSEQPAVALTEHGWMASSIELYKACKKENLKAILGIEAYVTNDPDDFDGEKTRDNMHMVILAKDNVGYSRLCELSSAAFTRNFYYKPRIYKKSLEYLKGHVVVTTACLGGVLAKKAKFEKDHQERAIGCTPGENFFEDLTFYEDTFGEDFYLEVQGWDDGRHFQTEYNKMLLDIGGQRGLSFVLTADAHYLDAEDYELHKLLMAMQLKMTLSDYLEKSEMQYGPYFYVADSTEMMRRAIEIGCTEAFDNTFSIAEKCNVELELNKYKMPVFRIEDEPDYAEWRKTYHE